MRVLADVSGLLEDWEISLLQADCPFKLDAGFGPWVSRWPTRLAACLFCASMLEQTKQESIENLEAVRSGQLFSGYSTSQHAPTSHTRTKTINNLALAHRSQ